MSKGKPKTTNLIADRKNASSGHILSGSERQPDGSFKLQNGAKIGRRMKEYGVRRNIWYYTTGRGNSTKDEIAIRTAIWAWEKQISEIYPLIENDEYKNGNGLSRLSIIFSVFKKLYKTQPEFLRFIYFFFFFAVNSGIKKEILTSGGMVHGRED